MKVFCILSDERAFASKSPIMHNAVLRRVGIRGVYVPFAVEPDRIGEAVRGIRALNIAGANVTVPYKEKIAEHLDVLSEEAAAIAAVNTIVPSNRSLEGHNTDAGGFLDALASVGFDVAGREVLVLGTGGAARAVLFALCVLARARVTLTGRDERRVRQLSAEFGASMTEWQGLSEKTQAAELLVNATSVSTAEESPRTAEMAQRLKVEGCRLVVDLNYGRKGNYWEQFAQRRGVRFMNGLPMLAAQAARSFTLWTGITVGGDAFMEALQEGR